MKRLQLVTYCVTDIVNRMYVTYPKMSEVHEAKYLQDEAVEMCHSDLPFNSKANFAN
jgi:hypothetical protein